MVYEQQDCCIDQSDSSYRTATGRAALLKEQLKKLEIWEQAYIKEVIDRVVSDLGIGFGKIGLPLRLALTATVNSPSIDQVCEILGKEITFRRLENFLTKIQNLKNDQ